MARPKMNAGTPAAYWTQQVGLKPHTVTAYEHSDKGLTVYLRWSPLAGAGGPPEKMSLGFKLRDSITRKRDAERQQEAINKAKWAYNRLLKGEDPRSPEKLLDEDGAVKLTIAKGLEHALSIPDGMFAVKNEHWRDMCRYKTHVLSNLPLDVTTWDKLTSVSYQHMWQRLAHWRVKVDERTRYGEIVGKRAAELAVVLLSQAGRWLKRAQKLKDLPDMPDEHWKDHFSADWARITGDAVFEREQPRYTPEELGLLLLNVDNTAADPRIRLVFRLAGEARLGQGLEGDRLKLDLAPVGKFGAGRYTIPDVVTKGGVIIDITPEDRAAIDYEMRDGYLRDLEFAYQQKLIRTYPLFPGKRLIAGVARLDATQPIGDRGATDLWHEFERVAGVEVIPGRSWYGVRRTGTDLANDVENDERALNAITGHKSSATRTRVYQAKKRKEVIAKAAVAREAARASAIEAARQAAREGRLVVSQQGAPSSDEIRVRTPRGPRKAASFSPRACPTCGNEFTPTGPNTKKCGACSPRRQRPIKARHDVDGTTLKPAPLTPELTPNAASEG